MTLAVPLFNAWQLLNSLPLVSFPPTTKKSHTPTFRTESLGPTVGKDAKLCLSINESGRESIASFDVHFFLVATYTLTSSREASSLAFLSVHPLTCLEEGELHGPGPLEAAFFPVASMG